MSCRLLPWDSTFFGVRVATVEETTLTDETVAAIDAFCTAESIDCLYFRARPDDARSVRLAESSGFHLVDVRLTLDRSAGRGMGFQPMRTTQPEEKNLIPESPSTLTPPARAGSPCHTDAIRLATNSDVPALQRIARVSHTDSRFYFDGRFTRERCDELYATWIANAVNGTSRAVLVADVAGQPVGYVTCDATPDEKTGAIGLVAIDAAHQGKGLGGALVSAAVEWFATAGITRITVVTQGRNLAAQRLYARAGFIARDLQLYYHRWF